LAVTPQGLGKRVLLASNHRLKASLIAATLDEAGFEVTTAAGARAAIEIANKAEFDAFLVDLDGFGTTARFLAIELRALDPCAQLIGFGEDRYSAPCDITLGRPFSPAQLVDLVLASFGIAAPFPSPPLRPDVAEFLAEFGPPRSGGSRQIVGESLP
jgi:CheY-like chemotaxis protein